MAILFNIKHEVDLSEYDSTVTDGGDLSQGTPGLAHTAGRLECLIDDTTGIYGQKDQSPPASNEIRYRFYVDPNTLTMAENDTFTICTPGGATAMHLTAMSYSTGSYRIRANHYDDGGFHSVDQVAISDAEHHIEVHIERATSDIAANGRVRWWLDGVLQNTWSSVDNWDLFDELTRFRMGAIGGIEVGTSGTLYLDELKANDDGTEIGPVYVVPPKMHHYQTRRM